MDDKRASLVVKPDKWEVNRDKQFDFLLNKGLQLHHKVLDLGCGVLIGGIPVIGYLDTGNYYGLDNSDKRLAEGMKEVGDSGLIWKQPHLYLGYDKIEKLDVKFDYIWFHQVIIHMLDDVSQEVMHFIKKVLAPDGACFITANIADENKTSISTMKYPCEWDLVHRTKEFYNEITSNAGLSINKIVGDMMTIKHEGE